MTPVDVAIAPGLHPMRLYRAVGKHNSPDHQELIVLRASDDMLELYVWRRYGDKEWKVQHCSGHGTSRWHSSYGETYNWYDCGEVDDTLKLELVKVIIGEAANV